RVRECGTSERRIDVRGGAYAAGSLVGSREGLGIAQACPVERSGAWAALVRSSWPARLSWTRPRRTSNRAYWRALNGYGTPARGRHPKRYGWSWSPAPCPSWLPKRPCSLSQG